MPCSTRRMLLATLLAGLLAGPVFGAKTATPKPPTPPKKSTSNPAVEAMKQGVNLSEADLLRDAYVLLATANADYAGHRAHAMGAVQRAVKLLDRKVLTKGTAAQKQATLAHDSAAAQAKIVDKYVQVPGGVKKPQLMSDLQLRA